MVGSVKTEINGSFTLLICVNAAEVLAICIRENKPSCIRAPPLAANEAKDEISRAADIGGFILSAQALEIIREYERRSKARHQRSDLTAARGDLYR